MTFDELYPRLSPAERELAATTEPAARRLLLDELGTGTTFPLSVWQTVLLKRYPAQDGREIDALIGLWLELFMISRSGVSARQAAKQYRRCLADPRWSMFDSATFTGGAGTGAAVLRLELFNAALRYLDLTLSDKQYGKILFGLVPQKEETIRDRLAGEVRAVVKALEDLPAEEQPAAGRHKRAQEQHGVLAPQELALILARARDQFPPLAGH